MMKRTSTRSYFFLNTSTSQKIMDRARYFLRADMDPETSSMTATRAFDCRSMFGLISRYRRSSFTMTGNGSTSSAFSVTNSSQAFDFKADLYLERLERLLFNARQTDILEHKLDEFFDFDLRLKIVLARRLSRRTGRGILSRPHVNHIARLSFAASDSPPSLFRRTEVGNVDPLDGNLNLPSSAPCD